MRHFTGIQSTMAFATQILKYSVYSFNVLFAHGAKIRHITRQCVIFQITLRISIKQGWKV